MFSFSSTKSTVACVCVYCVSSCKMSEVYIQAGVSILILSLKAAVVTWSTALKPTGNGEN